MDLLKNYKFNKMIEGHNFPGSYEKLRPGDSVVVVDLPYKLKGRINKGIHRVVDKYEGEFSEPAVKIILNPDDPMRSEYGKTTNIPPECLKYKIG